MRARLAAVALLLVAVALPARAGDVTGRVLLDLPGMQLADIGPVVVYLAPAPGLPERRASAQPSLQQKNATFVPEFLAISVGQRIAMPNDDDIFHNVFSYSKPNDFDLGLYAGGESREVAFAHPGAVKLYCSIHESMNGTVFVAPTAFFAVATADGSFTLRGVPPGKHRLRTWNEKLPDVEHPIDVTASSAAVVLSLIPSK